LISGSELEISRIDNKIELISGVLRWRMAELEERLGRTKSSIECCQKVIQTDPFFEEAYQKLMTTYLSLGRRSEVIRTYENCRKALQGGLNVDPDELTTSLYRRALESS
jgi:LuxR family transcriptional regulator, maltose regulon positive regulatory protein